MTSLVNLSPELLQQITLHLEEADLAPLRLTSRHLSSAVDEAFFKTLVLPTNRLNAALLEAIGNNNSRCAEHVRELVVAPGRSVEGRNEDDERWESFLGAALANLSAVSTVRYKLTSHDPTWLLPTIFGALAHFPHLTTFDLIVDLHTPIILPPFRPTTLEAFSVVAPVVYPPLDPDIGDEPPATLDGPEAPTFAYQIVSGIVAPNLHLRALYLARGDDWEHVWEALMRNEVELEVLQTNRPSTKCLAYLSSCSSRLRVLSLVAHDAGSEEANDRNADLFFSVVLPRLAGTLCELRCSPAYESRWCLGAHNVESFMELRNLKVLEVSLDSGPVARMQDDFELLIETALSLPRLTKLAVLPSMLESSRGASCGSGALGYLQSMATKVDRVAGVLGPKFADRVIEVDDEGEGAGRGWDYEVQMGPRHLRVPSPSPFGVALKGASGRMFCKTFWAGRVIRV